MYLYLPKKDKEFYSYYDHYENKSISYFGELTYINIFIGSNNSGKSRFIRNLLKYRFFLLNDNTKFTFIIKEIIELYESILLKLDSQPPTLLSRDMDSAHELIGNIGHFNIVSIKIKQNLKDKLYSTWNIDKDSFGGNYDKISLYQNLLNEKDINDYKFYIHNTLNHYDILKTILINNVRDFKYMNYELDNVQSLYLIKDDLIQLIDKLTNLIEFINFKVLTPKLVYIPILRSAVQFIGATEDTYELTIKENYQLESNADLEIFTGLKFHEIIKINKEDDLKVRKLVREFEKFLSKTFFNDDAVELVARNKTNNKAIKLITFTIGDEVERELYNVGDGINAIIIIMYKLFTSEDNSWIFIEEPETNLHPGFQRIFLKTILQNEVIKRKNLKIFITTHSNHLLDISSQYIHDISFFVFEKSVNRNEEKFYIQKVNRNDMKILNALGVNNSSVLLANCTVWVEGITDRKYINLYLNAYYKSSEFNKYKQIYNEDINYSFFEYSGSNIEHYIFGNEEIAQHKINSRYLSNRIFLLADKDKGKDDKHILRYKKLGLNFEYQNTIVKEIENLISPTILSKVLPTLTNSLTTDDIDEISINEKEYENIGLGEYLIVKFKDKITKNISADSGTLSQYYKDKLPDLVANYITWENMTENSKLITKKIYDFIEKHNNL